MSYLHYHVENGIAHVELNRPDKHNALNEGMFTAIVDCISRIKKDKAVRVVIVSGNGASFCSGLDVKSVMGNPKSALKLMWKWLPGSPNLAQQVSVGWRRLPVPVIMAIHGKCWGGGMQIALGGDYRIATPDSSLSVLEAKWGLIPDMGGTLGMRECMGIDHAKRIAITAEELTPEEALSIGLISKISDSPTEEAQKLAHQLMARSPDVNKRVKRMYQQVWGTNERQILAKETINQIKIFMGKNQKIAVKRSLGNSDSEYEL
ncbi:crotonase/enoyl-CoA hydratase family protein [Alteromonas sp. McT4-15]|uniref:crotonase/enoyl-CoA hydratase family protein n=1 Tax=Alteromonas sp. McT4-15 TaxID=2881256 RepID=UPI001CF88D1D|nr:crotonase/enoyl-CoA hydratase family protein [Alteromonas sp. McT4-15]MCB4437469.1 crotonase/enoyl-CoA hydratase family protein [Alteromonas sp. McT4-15]MEC8232074.1 crotonase/enoyl-CoA hydratase family protein [Pseudomonadota bacterium]